MGIISFARGLAVACFIRLKILPITPSSTFVTLLQTAFVFDLDAGVLQFVFHLLFSYLFCALNEQTWVVVWLPHVGHTFFSSLQLFLEQKVEACTDMIMPICLYALPCISPFNIIVILHRIKNLIIDRHWIIPYLHSLEVVRAWNQVKPRMLSNLIYFQSFFRIGIQYFAEQILRLF